MRDLVDCCPEAESDCGDGKPKAEAIGCDVYVGNNIIARFDYGRSEDYAYYCTIAREYARLWNEREGRT